MTITTQSLDYCQKYFIVLTLRGQDWCAVGVGGSYSAISETLISGEFITMFISTAFMY